MASGTILILKQELVDKDLPTLSQFDFYNYFERKTCNCFILILV